MMRARNRAGRGVVVPWLGILAAAALMAGCVSRGPAPPDAPVEPVEPAGQRPAATPPAAPGMAVPEALPLDSREYKVLLRRDRFEDRAAGAEDFWDLVVETAKGAPIEVERADSDEKSRRVWFLDTRDFALREQTGFVFRERLGLKDSGAPKKSKKVTLKYRGADRALAASLELAATEGEELEQKLEEDVVFRGAPDAPVVRKLSKSGNAKLPRTRGFVAVVDVADLFPAVSELVADLRHDGVAVVNHFMAHEVKRDAGTVALGGECEAEASFSFWYAGEGEPLVAEFSFGYEVEPDCTEAGVDARAEGLLIALGGSDWRDPNSKTKTEVAYEYGRAP